MLNALEDNIELNKFGGWNSYFKVDSCSTILERNMKVAKVMLPAAMENCYLAINEETKEIIVGNDVWIGARATILKGSVIPSHSIIGAMSLISRVFKKEYTVIAGNPAVIIKHNVTYEIKRTDF